MLKYCKLFAVLLIIVQIWTVSSQSTNATINLSVEGESKILKETEVKTHSVNNDEVISNLKDELSQCRAESETQADSALSTILRGIQRIQSNTCDNNLELKEKDEMIASQKVQLEEKLKLLDNQINETIKSYQQVAEYNDQIWKLKSTLISYKAKISKLEAANKQNNQTTQNFSLKKADQIDLKSPTDKDVDIFGQLDICQKQIEDMQKAKQDKSLLKEALDVCENEFTNARYRHVETHYDLKYKQSDLTKCNTSKDVIRKQLSSKEDQLNDCTKKKRRTPAILPLSYQKSCVNMADDIKMIQIANEKPFHVRCDGDGWMIIQQRINGHQLFNRSWQEYVDGFGDLNGDFFIGLEKLHLITNSTRHQLKLSIRFDRERDNSKIHDVQYDDFRIGNSESSYELESIGKFTGNRFMNGFEGNEKQKFSTTHRFGRPYGGGWWYTDLYNRSNLNTAYMADTYWVYFGVMSVTVKIRPFSEGNIKSNV